MNNVLLVGCGSEIGSMLVGMNDPQAEGFQISAILTNPIPDDPNNPDLAPIDSICARIVLAQPHLLDEVECDRSDDSVICRGNRIKVHWGDSATFDLTQLGDRFDVCILATSTRQIRDNAVIGRFREVADFVIGMSEAAQIPALYPNLIGAPERFLPNPPRPMGEHRTICIGSCQTNGWLAQLRVLLDLADDMAFEEFEICGLEIDIVHPDTPTGRLGTKSIEARSQDPRNNLRPSFSQVESTMNLLFPESNNVNTISLRTLTMPPGYQICRFFLRYRMENGKRLTREAILRSCNSVATRLPNTLRVAHIPLGSRGFEFCEASAIVLAGERYLRFYDNPFKIPEIGNGVVSEIITQAYVHNVRGYCRSVLDVIRHLLTSPSPKVFYG